MVRLSICSSFLTTIYNIVCGKSVENRFLRETTVLETAVIDLNIGEGCYLESAERYISLL